MVKANAITPECRAWCGVLIRLRGGQDRICRRARCFDSFYALIIRYDQFFNLVKAALSWFGFGSDVNNKKYIITAFLNDARLIYLTIPNQIENGAILKHFVGLASYW